MDSLDVEGLVGSVLRGVLGGGRKQSRGALRYLTSGRSSLLNASTLLTVAGVAWGLWETASKSSAAWNVIGGIVGRRAAVDAAPTRRRRSCLRHCRRARPRAAAAAAERSQRRRCHGHRAARGDSRAAPDAVGRACRWNAGAA